MGRLDQLGDSFTIAYDIHSHIFIYISLPTYISNQDVISHSLISGFNRKIEVVQVAAAYSRPAVDIDVISRQI